MAMPETAAAAAVEAAVEALGREGLVLIIHMETDADRISEMFVLGNKLPEMHTEEWKHFPISAVKEGQDDDPKQAKYIIMFYRAAFERGIMPATCRKALDIVEKHLLPFSRAAENTVLCTNRKAGAYSFFAMHKMEEDNMKLHFGKAQTAYEATSKEDERLSAIHALQHALHLTKTALFSDVKECPGLATALAKLALHKAGPELASLDGGSYKKIAETIGIMQENLKTAVIMGLTYEELNLWEPTRPNSKDYSEAFSEKCISPKLASLWLEQEPSYSGGSSSLAPPLVVPLPAGPPVSPNKFISPGDWGSEGLASREIRCRRKEAKIKRGFMG